MRRIFVSTLLACLAAAPCAAAGSSEAKNEDPPRAAAPAADPVPAETAVEPPLDESSIYRKQFYASDPFGPPPPPSRPVVNISEQYGVAEGDGPRKNIDGYLGEFENPYAPLEATYEGSQSETRNMIRERQGHN